MCLLVYIKMLSRFNIKSRAPLLNWAQSLCSCLNSPCKAGISSQHPNLHSNGGCSLCHRDKEVILTSPQVSADMGYKVKRLRIAFLPFGQDQVYKALRNSGEDTQHSQWPSATSSPKSTPHLFPPIRTSSFKTQTQT